MRITLFVVWYLCSALSSLAQTYPPGFSQVLVAGGISTPTVIAFAPDSRIFVARQNGVLRLIKDGALVPTSVIELTVNSTGERGLLGIAFDPDFATNNYMYLYYTVPSPLHNRVSRFTLNGDVADPANEQIIIDLDPLSASNHNGGALAFGPDGKLYIAIGENAVPSNAQSLTTYHGKILRINKDGSVPEDNPFFAQQNEKQRRIWAYGLRNPYTIAFQPGTGRFFVNDVGASSWEEINDATFGGRNFGWPTVEGNSANPNFTNPVYAYPHGGGDGNGCAITGGTFFNPSSTNYPSQYYGKYFFQDLCNAWINTIDISGSPATRASFVTGIPGNALSVTTGPDGNLYFLSRSNGALYKVIYNNTSAPLVTDHPDDVQVSQGEPASFSVSAVGSLPLNYQWQKNSVTIDGATASSYTINNTLPSDGGAYRVIVSNVAGEATSNEATLSVTPVNQKPIANIVSPTEGTTYVAGTSIAFSGTGTDYEDGDMPASAFSWGINFHHDAHVHDQPAIEGIKNGVFDIPNEGETSPNVWYRFILTVEDSEGRTGKDSVDVHPKTSQFTFATKPAGMEITLDGQPLTPPATVESVEGMLRTIGVTTPQVVGDVEYEFASWNNGGAATQIIATPAEDIALTANFSVVVATENYTRNDQSVALLSNPVRQEYITLLIRTAKDQTATIHVTDLLARQTIETKKLLSVGENRIPVFAGNLSNGLYIISVEVDGMRVVKKVVLSK